MQPGTGFYAGTSQGVAGRTGGLLQGAGGRTRGLVQRAGGRTRGLVQGAGGHAPASPTAKSRVPVVLIMTKKTREAQAVLGVVSDCELPGVPHDLSTWWTSIDNHSGCHPQVSSCPADFEDETILRKCLKQPVSLADYTYNIDLAVQSSAGIM